MRISERVYMVGSGRFGNEISHSMDCNVFLVDGGSEYAMIDAGSGVEPEQIIANIEREGIAMDKVNQLLLTHVHGDHAAGASFFYKKYGIKVICAKESAPWLEKGDMTKTSINVAKKGGVYPPEFHFPACPVERSVVENDLIQVGDLILKVLETPGHSRGHISFLMELNNQRSLFAGDTIFAGGKVVIQNIWDCFIQEYAETTSKLHGLSIDTLYPGHGVVLLSQGWKHIQVAHDCFTRLEIPPNL